MSKQENKRSVFRVDLPINMCGKIQIHKIHGNEVASGVSYICISDISAGGLKFNSKLNFPIENVTYKMYFNLFNEDYCYESEIRWKSENKNGTFTYGVKFNHSPSEKEKLIRLTTQLSIRIKGVNDNVYTHCSKKARKSCKIMEESI